jgi:pimeloyl-ACP methyl ester carboxylesterase
MTDSLVDVGRISVACEQFGGPDGVPLVLIAGLGMQLNSWPTEFCELLTGRGYRVVRFDNRDAGRSTHLGFPPPRPFRMLTRRWHPDQYNLADMAADTAGVLDALGLADAHLVGISMGGMIAQTVAARYPGKARSLTSIMSTTGARRVGRPAPSTWLLMLARPPRDRAEFIDREVRIFRHIGSAGFPFDETWLRAIAAESWARDPSGGAAGTARQLAAIFKSGDRTAEVAAIAAPTLVIHGDHDRMVNPTGGARTAQTIPGARLETIEGMGHDLPRGAWPVLVDLIDAHIRGAEAGIATEARRQARP